MTHSYKSLLLLVLLSVSIVAFSQRSDCGVSPEMVNITQADGSKLSLVSKGTESVHYSETAEGYTVLENANHIYEYAVIGPDGNLTLSGIKAKERFADVPASGKNLNISKHLRYSKAQIDLLVQYHQQLEEVNSGSMGKAGPNVFPPSGNRKVIILLMQYPDLLATVPKANFELLFNQTNYQGTGSIKDYYKRASFGALDITSSVYGWYTADSGYKYYGKTSSPSYGTYTRNLLKKGLVSADSAINYADFDTDNDGYVDAVLVLHSGIGAEESSAPNSGDYIWSFRSTLSASQTPTHDGKKFSAYAMFPEKRSSGFQVGIGVISHEFGHILDMPDLYATAFNGSGAGPEGVGNFANMAGGGWLNGERTPCMHDAWTKIQMNWMTPVVLTTSGTYTIAKASVDSNFAYKIMTSRSNEYFLLENRQLKGQDRYIPARGLSIWHVNTLKAGKLSVISNNANNDTSNLGLGLMQADGERDLEFGNNRGDAKDLFPYTTKNAFTPATNPGSQLYYKVSGVRQNSNIYITNIVQNADSSITFKFGASATAAFTPSAIAGCAPLTVSFANNSIFSVSSEWTIGTEVTTENSPTRTFSTPGVYTVWLRSMDSSNNAVDSVMKTINVVAEPVSAFTWTRIDTNTIRFVNTSTNANSYQWKLNTFTANVSNPGDVDLKSLSPSGNVFFSLVAISDGGCSDTSTTEIPILSTWSGNTAVGENAADFANISVHPNPSNSDVTLQMESSVSGSVEVNVVNILGETLYRSSMQLSSGSHSNVNIPSTAFGAAGLYFVQVRSQSATKTLRLVRH